MAKKIKIVIADDHPLFLSGLKQTLQSVEYFSIIGEAKDGKIALEIIRLEQPDCAILDIQMPKMNGLEIVAAIDREQIRTKPILLTMFKNPSYFYQAVLNGVKGYILKETADFDLIKAVEIILAGQTFISEPLNHFIQSDETYEMDNWFFKQAIKSLTVTEKKVLKKIAEWKTNNEIAAELFISPRTVGTHRNHISDKLNLHGQYSLIRFAIENKEIF